MSHIYRSGLQALLDSSLAWETADIRAALLGAGYAFSYEHHTFQDVLRWAAGTSDPLPDRSVEDLTAACGATYVLASREARCAGVAVYNHKTGALIAYSPIAPVHPVLGQRVDVSWPDGAVFSLRPAEE